ncbi:hypothetical protein LEP1GSC021_0326 [Leptospira noguchii str. 1993005606]|uniref:Uncharacterized protein n=3 Tax=Leptospira noguchii TaxID=28182 RepID=M6Y8F4_9LEPT|nr:hypothetical protein LEP1GSC041_2781 [Leptospira noguchii str. 2006001870]EMN02510.1 hypothetical protein LEP1GSC035_2575 [Leptospira noguchii str. 2007001578]EMO25651.1 hypothetical protein LEP1GSC170_3543 [Leptospira interrogans serovar Bataviae str. HAI135]EMO38850.1 hypothetical protein LEP1GSC186_2925 [Leptospira noguchii serovar Autumnalis str. ZUN142]EMO90617.1 hypothetical protein LEP1GSC024_4358 [Leptospira noguchii str. 2001034031]EMS88974.1 hypothetical protein LEP1GSC074_2908 [L
MIYDDLYKLGFSFQFDYQISICFLHFTTIQIKISSYRDFLI